MKPIKLLTFLELIRHASASSQSPRQHPDNEAGPSLKRPAETEADAEAESVRNKRLADAEEANPASAEDEEALSDDQLRARSTARVWGWADSHVREMESPPDSVTAAGPRFTVVHHKLGSVSGPVKTGVRLLQGLASPGHDAPAETATREVRFAGETGGEKPEPTGVSDPPASFPEDPETSYKEVRFKTHALPAPPRVSRLTLTIGNLKYVLDVDRPDWLPNLTVEQLKARAAHAFNDRHADFQFIGRQFWVRVGGRVVSLADPKKTLSAYGVTDGDINMVAF